MEKELLLARYKRVAAAEATIGRQTGNVKSRDYEGSLCRSAPLTTHCSDREEKRRDRSYPTREEGNEQAGKRTPPGSWNVNTASMDAQGHRSRARLL